MATLSLGLLGGAWSRTLDAAATALVRDHNITLVAAAGNGCCPQSSYNLYFCRGTDTEAVDNINVSLTLLITLQLTGSIMPAQHDRLG